jgi:hypothetical protein
LPAKRIGRLIDYCPFDAVPDVARGVWSSAVTTVKAVETTIRCGIARLLTALFFKALSVDLFFSLPLGAGFFHWRSGTGMPPGCAAF